MSDEEKKNNGFSYTYSAKQQEEVQNIRKKYLSSEESGEEDKMERLRKLDAGVTKKGKIASLTVGIIGALILGFGMSLAMSSLGAFLGEFNVLCGALIGTGGIILVCSAYPIYTRITEKEKARIAPEILRLTDELMK